MEFKKIKTEIRNWKKREPLDLSSLIELADPRIQRRAPIVVHGQCTHMENNKGNGQIISLEEKSFEINFEF